MKKLMVRSFVGCLLSSRALHLGSAKNGKLEVKDHICAQLFNLARDLRCRT